MGGGKGGRGGNVPASCDGVACAEDSALFYGADDCGLSAGESERVYSCCGDGGCVLVRVGGGGGCVWGCACGCCARLGICG